MDFLRDSYRQRRQDDRESPGEREEEGRLTIMTTGKGEDKSASPGKAYTTFTVYRVFSRVERGHV